MLKRRKTHEEGRKFKKAGKQEDETVDPKPRRKYTDID